MTWTSDTKNTSTQTALPKNMAGASWDIKGFLQQEDCFTYYKKMGIRLYLIGEPPRTHLRGQI